MNFVEQRYHKIDFPKLHATHTSARTSTAEFIKRMQKLGDVEITEKLLSHAPRFAKGMWGQVGFAGA